MDLNFSLDEIKEQTLNIKKTNYENGLSAAYSFILLLVGLDYETIDNLCEEVSKNTGVITLEIYNSIQSGKLNEEFALLILDCAYSLIDSNKLIGNKMNGKFNASSWISHSLYEGRVAKTLAEPMGLNPDVAMKLGLLHDIGRKFDHSFMHTIKGYEYLCNLGYNDDAVCCLTHSFLPIITDGALKGNRCANCDPAAQGFYVNENGEGLFKQDVKKDDVTLFLEQYNYNLYDIILNISDLMAMSEGITSPYDRVLDVYTRKAPDPNNSPFFKVCFVNLMRKLLFMITNDKKYNGVYNIKNMKSLEEIDNLLINTANEFMAEYNNLIKLESNKKLI